MKDRICEPNPKVAVSCQSTLEPLAASQGAFRVRPTPKIRQEFRSCTPSGRRGADASNLVPSPQARLSPLLAANAKERRSNEDRKVDGLKTYGSVYLFMLIITSTTFLHHYKSADSDKAFYWTNATRQSSELSS